MSVPAEIYRTTLWLSSPPYCVESGFRYHGDKKRGSERASSHSLYFWNGESGIVMCFLCQGRQKMSEQVCVCCWTACQLSPFAVTRHPMWHYSGTLRVVSPPYSLEEPGKTCFFFPLLPRELMQSSNECWCLNFDCCLWLSRSHKKFGCSAKFLSDYFIT